MNKCLKISGLLSIYQKNGMIKTKGEAIVMKHEKDTVEKQNSKVQLTKKQSLIQVLKFVAFSMGAGIIQIVSFTILREATTWQYWACYLPSLILSVLYNFTVNRRYTFKSATNVPIAMLKVFLFYCVFTPVSLWLGQVAAQHAVNQYLIELLTMLCNLVTEFLFCRFFVYRDSINTNDLGKKEEQKKAEEVNSLETSLKK